MGQEEERPIYLGVDVAGASNTWVTALSPGEDGLEVVHVPRLATLESIVGYCEENDVVAVAIDAQLTIALSEESGFRASDLHLRYEALDLSVVAHKDGTLEVSWGGGRCSMLRGRG